LWSASQSSKNEIATKHFDWPITKNKNNKNNNNLKTLNNTPLIEEDELSKY
jgi:hypothetical protein